MLTSNNLQTRLNTYLHIYVDSIPQCQCNRMSKSQRNKISPAHADDPANPTTHPGSTMEFNEEELKVIKILNEKNSIMAIAAKSRTQQQNKALRASNNKVNCISK